eukprot:7677368-Alexandrium_andersonii.AAC.1
MPNPLARRVCSVGFSDRARACSSAGVVGCAALLRLQWLGRRSSECQGAQRRWPGLPEVRD